MRAKFRLILTFLFVSALSISCGKGSSKNSESNNYEVKDDYVAVDSISSEYNPREGEFSFSTLNITKFKVSLQGFSSNVQMTYSDSLPPDQGIVKYYTVSKNSRFPLGALSSSVSGSNLKIDDLSNYECSIRVRNREIVDLSGGCYVKVLVVLPKGLEAEVYNLEKLISKRFFPMTNEEFLLSLDEASHDEQKLEVIRTFKESYRLTGKTIKLTSTILGEVLKEFPFKKFDILQDLHVYVYDRSNLQEMVDAQFTFYDRKRAMDIVGMVSIADAL